MLYIFYTYYTLIPGTESQAGRRVAGGGSTHLSAAWPWENLGGSTMGLPSGKHRGTPISRNHHFLESIDLLVRNVGNEGMGWWNMMKFTGMDQIIPLFPTKHQWVEIL